jgi:hypothetical protein
MYNALESGAKSNRMACDSKAQEKQVNVYIYNITCIYIIFDIIYLIQYDINIICM